MKKIYTLMFILIMMLSTMSLSYASTDVMHTIQSGDTYYSISSEFNTSVDALLDMNNKQNDLLYEGDLLTVNTIPETISIYVNGVRLATDANPYLENDRTQVPIRFISEALGFEISWDDENKRAIITADGTEIILPIGSNTAYINGLEYTLDSNIQIYQDRTFVPVRFVAETLGCTVDWNGSTYTVSINETESTMSTSTAYSSEDLYWLSRIVEAEAKGESYEGKLAVANIVINRTEHSEFPNTIKEVIFDTQYGVQFSPIKDGAIYNTPSQESIDAAIAALEGNNNISDCLYFLNPSKLTYSWIMNAREKYTEIGNHDFYL